MNILLSAFACDPEEGSEAGVGWAWACQLAELGHDVCVITRLYHRQAIEQSLSSNHRPHLRFIYVDLRHVPWYIPGFGVYLYYFAWQLKIFLLVNRLVNLKTLDCIQHLTYGSYRTPFLLSWLGIPSIFGPIGGGETTPFRLTKGMSFGSKVSELGRILFNALNRFNPIAELVYRRSTLILVTTAETLHIVPLRYRSKCKIQPAVTIPQVDLYPVRVAKSSKARRAIFVGRLLEWKGAHLAIEALAIARQSVPDMTLTIVGYGKCEDKLRSLAKDKRVESGIEWVPRITREHLMNVYDSHLQILVFTNVRDAGGTVVLEALSRGVPVICLRLGAFGSIVDSSCGASVEVDGRSMDEIVRSIADEMIRFHTMQESEFETNQIAARDHAARFTVEQVVNRAYSYFADMKAARLL